MCTPVYKPDVKISQMLADGWSRGFRVCQTVRELESMGVSIHPETVQAYWHRLSRSSKMMLQATVNIDPIINHIFDLPWEQSCSALRWYCAINNSYYYARPSELFSMVEARRLALEAGCTSLILEDLS